MSTETNPDHADALRRQAAVHGALARWWWVAVGGALIVFVPLVVWFFVYSSPLRSTGHEFVEALQAADYKRAYDLCSVTLQQQLGDERQLQQLVESQPGFYTPGIWTHISIHGDQAELECTSESPNAENGQWAKLYLQKDGKQWRVTKFQSARPPSKALQIPPP